MTDTPPGGDQTQAASTFPQSADAGYAHQPWGGQPGYREPAYGQPWGGQPWGGQPGYGQPGYGQPGGGQLGFGPGPAGYSYPPYGFAGPQGGWNAVGAPAPGSVPLRPLGVGDILSGAFSLIRQNPAATLGLTASVVTSLGVALMIIFVIASRAAAVTLIAAPLVISLLALQLGGLTAATGRSLLGRRLTIAEAVQNSRTGWVILAVLLLTVLFAGLWLPLIILLKGWGVLPGLVLTAWLAVMLSLTIPVVVLERRGPIAALGRSWQLVLGSYWRVFGIYLLMYLITSALSFVVNLPLQFLTGLASAFGPVRGGTGLSLSIATLVIGEIVIVSLSTTIETAVLVLVYADMRMRKEGMDLVLQQAAQNQQLTGDEFATSRLTSAYTGGAYPGGAYPGGAYPGGAYPGGEYPGGGYPGGAFPGRTNPGGPYPAGPPAI